MPSSGLLAVKPWTTYELAQQMDRALSWFWPRARSKLYEEPKKLVAHGLAKATLGAVGRRPRTTYSITPKGKRALEAWVAEPGAGPVLEFEQLVKVFYAENGSREDIRRTLHDARDWAHARSLVSIDLGTSYLETGGAFRDRAAINQLVGRFLDDFLETVDSWATWAEGVIDTWPDEPSSATADRSRVRSHSGPG